MKKKSNMFLALLPGIFGAAAFVLFAFLFNVNFLVAIGIGLTTFIALSLIFSKKKEIEFKSNGISKEKYQEVMSEGEKKLGVLRSFQKEIKNNHVNVKLKAIIIQVEKIFDDLKKDPKDIKVARQFLSYYLDTTIKILTKYIEISNQDIKSEKIQETLRRVEELLDMIEKAFEKQLEKLLNDDILDLDSELEVLERTIKLEGVE